jgi:hypothetical protein
MPEQTAVCDQLRSLQSELEIAVHDWEQFTFSRVIRRPSLSGIPASDDRHVLAARNRVALRIVDHLRTCATCKPRRAGR